MYVTSRSYRVEVVYWVHKDGRAVRESEAWYTHGAEPRALDVAMQFGEGLDIFPADINKYRIENIVIEEV